MVARCLETGESFCVVHADDDGMRSVGCLAGDLEIVQRFEDGRLNIVVTGTDPVRIEDVDEDTHAYLSASGYTLEDDEDPASSDAMDAAMAAYRRLVSVAEGDEGPPEPDPGPRFSYGIASRIDFGSAIKQGLLEARSERARLADVTALVSRATRTVEAQKAVAERARTNGRVSSPGSDPGA